MNILKGKDGPDDTDGVKTTDQNDSKELSAINQELSIELFPTSS